MQPPSLLLPAPGETPESRPTPSSALFRLCSLWIPLARRPVSQPSGCGDEAGSDANQLMLSVPSAPLRGFVLWLPFSGKHTQTLSLSFAENAASGVLLELIHHSYLDFCSVRSVRTLIYFFFLERLFFSFPEHLVQLSLDRLGQRISVLNTGCGGGCLAV